MNRKIVIVVGCCLLAAVMALPGSVSWAAGGLNPAQRGKLAFENKDYHAAVQDFQKAFIDDPANLDISFYLGLAAFELGDYETAIMSFERILIMKPESMRVKLELARCHMRLGASESAKQYFYEVLASNPPQTVRANIENLLAAIAAAERRHFFSGMVSAGVSFDDNTRSAPGDFLFTFLWPDKTKTTLGVSAPPQSDYFTTASAVVNHIYRQEGSAFSWKTTATSINNLYGEYHDMDVNLLGISSGPVYETGHGLFEVHGMFNELQVEHEAYMRPAGIGASATISLGPKILTSATAALQKKDYMADSNSVKDATNFSLGLSPIVMLGDNRITATLLHEEERAAADYWSYGRRSWGLRYDRMLPLHFTVFAGITGQRTEYDASKPGDSGQRLDTLTDLYCGLTKLLWQSKNKSRSVLGQLSHTYTDSDSNIGQYDYRKNLSAGMISYGF